MVVAEEAVLLGIGEAWGTRLLGEGQATGTQAYPQWVVAAVLQGPTAPEDSRHVGCATPGGPVAVHLAVSRIPLAWLTTARKYSWAPLRGR